MENQIDFRMPAVPSMSSIRKEFQENKCFFSLRIEFQFFHASFNSFNQKMTALPTHYGKVQSKLKFINHIFFLFFDSILSMELISMSLLLLFGKKKLAYCRSWRSALTIYFSGGKKNNLKKSESNEIQ